MKSIHFHEAIAGLLLTGGLLHSATAVHDYVELVKVKGRAEAYQSVNSPDAYTTYDQAKDIEHNMKNELNWTSITLGLAALQGMIIISEIDAEERRRQDEVLADLSYTPDRIS